MKIKIFKLDLKNIFVLFPLFFTYLFLLIAINANATDGLNLRLNKPYVPNPNAADLGRFSAVQVGLFTGTAKYSIPLYEFKTNDLSVPITLEYGSNGLIVDKISSWVGFDWTLNVGGVINRFRKGKVDKPGTRPTYPSNWSSMTVTNKKDFLDELLWDDRDLEPDEFTFSFMNYSGKFIFDETGAIRQIPYTNLKIESSTSGGAYAFFKITTPDGVSFMFDKVGYTYPNTESAYPTSYYLTQIKHPNGAVVNFNYTTNSAFLQYNGVSQTATTVIQQNYQLLPPISLSEVSTGVNSFYSDAIFLDNIQFPNIGSIVFEKSNTTRLDSYGDYELKKIKILDYNLSVIRSFEFFHQFPSCSASYKSKTNLGITEPNSEHEKRMFLDSVQIQSNTPSKISSYVFKYNNLTELPARYSFSQDHWGYFNGKYNNDFAIITKVPGNYRGLFTNMVSSTADRSPDYLYAQKGMLQKIIFPTRGYTTIEYEPHKDDYNSILGGCRVVRTKTYDSPTSITPIVAKYLYSLSQTSLTYMYYTEYFNYRFSNGTIDGSVTYGKLSSNSLYNLSANGMYHILYGNVEILSGENAENGKEVHRFYVDIDQPAAPINNFTISDGQIYPLIMNNTGWKTGLQSSKSILDNSLTTLSTTATSYNFSETRNTKDISCLAMEKFYEPGGSIVGNETSLQPYKVIDYKIKSIWSYVNQEVVTQYASNGNVITTKNYSYNDYGLLSSESITGSDGNSVWTYYRYPFNINATPYTNMVSLNMLNYITEQYTVKNGYLTNGTLTTYKTDEGHYLPASMYNLEPTSSLSVTAFKPFGRDNTYRDPNYNSVFSYDDYNSSGNLLQTTTREGITTSYLWDSSGNYLMAEVKGATYAQINTPSYINVASTYSSNTLWTTLNSRVPNALITTYGYSPLIGVKNTTNSRGTTTFYDYDTIGRLRLVSDADNNIVNRYKYNYKL